MPGAFLPPPPRDPTTRFPTHTHHRSATFRWPVTLRFDAPATVRALLASRVVTNFKLLFVLAINCCFRLDWPTSASFLAVARKCHPIIFAVAELVSTLVEGSLNSACFDLHNIKFVPISPPVLRFSLFPCFGILCATRVLGCCGCLY